MLAIQTHHDDLLGVMAPFAIASGRQTCLVVDADPGGLPLPGRRTLAELVADGPTLDELRPHRAGIASLPGGGIAFDQAWPIIEALSRGWDDVIIRTRQPVPDVAAIHVVPDLPELEPPHRNTLWVRAGGPTRRPSAAAPPRRALAAAMTGRALRGRWLRSWHLAWDLPWR